MIKLVIVAVLVFNVVFGYACCKVSGECSRIEGEIEDEFRKRSRTS